MVINIVIGVFLIIVYMKIVFDICYILNSRKFIKEENSYYPVTSERINILLIIPVLREQNVIENTLNHFLHMNLNNVNLHVCVAGTSREYISRDETYVSTGDIVENWIIKNKDVFKQEISFSYSEVTEKKGDRASQLNDAVQRIKNDFQPHLIGVYDADSLPDIYTLKEVAYEYSKDRNAVFQQPVHFVNAANRMSREKKNPVLIANALYQTTWTAIRELPRWNNHAKFCQKNPSRLYFRNDYLIGHGEFVPYEVYLKYLFPEKEVTDGIQLGYRLSMSGVKIQPLHTFCVDDVPQKITQLIKQHKRWFGGCNRLWQSYKWCKENVGKVSILQMLDGYWSQISWAYASVFSVISICLSVYKLVNGESIFLIAVLAAILTYCYLIPILSHLIMKEKIHIRFVDWLALPVAIAIKGIGPNMYLIQKIISKIKKDEVKYSKVER